MIGEAVTAWRASDGTGELRGTVARLEEASDAGRRAPRQVRRPDPVARAAGADRAILLFQTRARSPTVPAWRGAACAPCTVGVPPRPPRHGAPALRRRVGEALRGPTAVGCVARRDDGPDLPPPEGEARSGRGAGSGRRRLSGGRPTRGDPGRRGGLTDHDEGRQASAAGQGRNARGRGEAQDPGAGEGRTSVPGRPPPLRLRQGPLDCEASYTGLRGTNRG